MKNYILALLFVCFVSVTYGQERIVQGKVSTLEKISVNKARITVKGTKQEVLTDSSGLFSVACNKNDKLKISAHGFYNEKVKVLENTKFVLVNIKLKPGIKNREYATGYGHVSDAGRLTAISNLDRDDTNFSRYGTMLELIQGQFSGVQVMGNEIIIRNSKTMYGSSAALIIVDGRKVDMSYLQEMYTGDVKSINILKDASASMYGMQGGNGVVVITTRRGGDN
jgi:TonB-dependent SusC/RagA subfamily outer membrane receptor